MSSDSKFPSTSLSRTTGSSYVPYTPRHPRPSLATATSTSSSGSAVSLPSLPLPPDQNEEALAECGLTSPAHIKFIQALAESPILSRDKELDLSRTVVFLPSVQLDSTRPKEEILRDHIFVSVPLPGPVIGDSVDFVDLASLTGLRATLDKTSNILTFRASLPSTAQNPPSPLPPLSMFPGYPTIKLGTLIPQFPLTVTIHPPLQPPPSSIQMRSPKPERERVMSNPFSSLFGRSSSSVASSDPLTAPASPSPFATTFEPPKPPPPIKKEVILQIYAIEGGYIAKNDIAEAILDNIRLHIEKTLSPEDDPISDDLKQHLTTTLISFATVYNLLPFFPTAPATPITPRAPSLGQHSNSSSSFPATSLSRSASPAPSQTRPPMPPSLPTSHAPFYTIPPNYTQESEIEDLELEWQDLCNGVEEEIKREWQERGGEKEEERVREILGRFERAFAFAFYDRVYRPPPSTDAAHDEALSARIAALNLLDLGMEQLGVDLGAIGFATVPSEKVDGEAKASEEPSQVDSATPPPAPRPTSDLGALDAVIKECGVVLQTLHAVYSPREKGEILVAAHRVVVDGLKTLYDTAFEGKEKSERPPPPSSDTLLPLLILSVLKSNPPHLVSNLLFVQRWRWREGGGALGGEEGFCLINLMAVADFLEHVDLEGLGLDKKGVDPAGLPPVPVRTVTPNITPPNTATLAPHATTRNPGVEVVDFIAGAGSKVIGAFGGGVGFVRGLVQPNTANPIVAVETATSQKTAPAITPGLENARNEAPWNGPTTPLSAVLNAKEGDSSVFEKQQQASPLPPPPTSAPVPSPLIQQGPGFGMLRRTSTNTGALLGGLGTLVSNAVTLGGPKRGGDMEGKMLVSLGPEKGESTTEDDTDGSEDEDSEDENEPKADARSIKSFEAMLSESQKKGKLKKRPKVAGLGIKTSTLTSLEPEILSPVPRLAPPIRRFLDVRSAKELRIGEIEELLKDYKRVVEGVRMAGGFEDD
ncbi:hypothetical protein DL96DRAFT_1708647 [Flagelloscypha sp. PMI_526]|nr:hypothetical protein DL96DRAFT_1708647 [Flagelloscypha sp. PMI_526]